MLGSLLLLPFLTLHTDLAPAYDTTRGASLLRGCQAEMRLMALDSLTEASQSDLINGAYCVGYLNGFTASLPPAPASVCPHDDSMGQMVHVYVSYMERNPRMLDEDKRVGLRRALEEAFPCSTAP